MSDWIEKCTKELIEYLAEPIERDFMESIIRRHAKEFIADTCVNKSISGTCDLAELTELNHRLTEALREKQEEIERLKKENDELRACHDAELGVCQEHCKVVAELNGKISALMSNGEDMFARGMSVGQTRVEVPGIMKGDGDE